MLFWDRNVSVIRQIALALFGRCECIWCCLGKCIRESSGDRQSIRTRRPSTHMGSVPPADSVSRVCHNGHTRTKKALYGSRMLGHGLPLGQYTALYECQAVLGHQRAVGQRVPRIQVPCPTRSSSGYMGTNSRPIDSRLIQHQ